MRLSGTIFPGSGGFRVRMEMKHILLITGLIIFSFSVGAQSNFSKIAGIDHVVQQIDQVADSVQEVFYLSKWQKNGDVYKETWHFTRQGNRVLVFQIRYVIDSVEYSEIYYLDRKRLIFSEEYETVYSGAEDRLSFARICHFLGLDLAQIVTLGRSRSYSPHFAAGYETMNKFFRRFRELEQHVQL